MSARKKRPWPAYVAAGLSGFTLAYVLVAAFVFPAGAAQSDALVPNVVGLQYADAEKKLAQTGFTVQRGEVRFHGAAPRGSVLSQDPEPESNAPPGARITLSVSGGPKVAAVPSIIGLSREQAQLALEQAGFTMGLVSERPSNEPRGAVIDARPRPGTQSPAPSPVALVVSAGPTNVVVPDLTGRPLSDAFQLLRQVGLRVGDVKTPAGAVIPTPDMAVMVQSQTPIAGNLVIAGTKVDLTVGGRAP